MFQEIEILSNQNIIKNQSKITAEWCNSILHAYFYLIKTKEMIWSENSVTL